MTNNKDKNVSDHETSKKGIDCWTLVLLGSSLFLGGYLTGRLTAVSDLKAGKLDMFIRNR